MQNKIFSCIFMLLMALCLHAQNKTTSIKGKIMQGFYIPECEDCNSFSNKVNIFSYSQHKVDSCVIAKDSTFEFKLNFEGITFLNIDCNNYRIRIVAEAGKNIDIVAFFDDNNISGKGLELTNQYDSYKSYLSSLLGDDYNFVQDIKRKDSVSYNAMLKLKLQSGNQFLNRIKDSLPNYLYTELYYYHQYNWANKYLLFAALKRKTEPFKKFNFVSENYLAPITFLLNKKDTLEESWSLNYDLKETCDTLLKYNFETKYFSEWEKNCHGKYLVLSPESDGQNCTWGYESEGYWTISPQYEQVERFNRNYLAIVKQNGKYGVIDQCTNFILPPSFESLTWLDSTRLIFGQDAKQGVVNINGQILIPAIYTSLRNFSQSYWINYQVGIIVSEPTKILFQSDKNGKYGIMDINGGFLIQPLYENIEWMGHGYYKILKTDSELFEQEYGTYKKHIKQEGIIDSIGNEVIPLGRYILRMILRQNKIFFLTQKIETQKQFDKKKKRNVQVIKMGNYGMTNQYGKQIISFKYQGYLNNWNNSLNSPIENLIVFNRWEKKNHTIYHYFFDYNLEPIFSEPIERLDKYDNYFFAKTNDTTYYLISDTLPNCIIDTFEKINLLNPDNSKDNYYHANYGFCYWLAAKKQGNWMLLDSNFKNVLTEKFDSVYKQGKWIITHEKNKIFVLDKNLKRLNVDGFETFAHWSYPWYKATRNGLTMLYDTGFNLVFSAVVDNIYIANRYDSTNKKLVSVDDYIRCKKVLVEKNDTLFYVLKKGNNYEYERAYSKTITAFQTGESYYYPANDLINSAQYIICNKEGKIILKTSNRFSMEDLAILEQQTGQFLFRYVKTTTTIGYDVNNKIRLIDMDGREIQPPTYIEIEPLYLYTQNTTYDTLVNAFNNYNDTLLFEKIYGYKVYKVYNYGRYGLMDKNFKLKLDTVYSYIDYKNGYILAFKQNKLHRDERHISDSFFLFDKSLKKILQLTNIAGYPSFLKDSILSIKFKNYTNEVYILKNNKALKLEFDDLKFDENETVFWGKKKNKWFLYNMSGQLLNPYPFNYAHNFYVGLTNIEGSKNYSHALIAKSGKFIVPFLKTMTLPLIDNDVRKEMSIKYTMNLTENNGEDSFCMFVYNRSNCNFSVYQSIEKKLKGNGSEDGDNNIKYFCFLNDERQPAKFVNAVNLAMLYNTDLSNDGASYNSYTKSRFEFKIQSDELFQLNNRTYSLYNNSYSDMNFFICNDSLYLYTADVFMNEIAKEKKGIFNRDFFEKIKRIEGANWESCITADQAFNFFKPSIEMHTDSVFFILNNLKVYYRDANSPTISYSYSELQSYLKQNNLLAIWSNRKRH